MDIKASLLMGAYNLVTLLFWLWPIASVVIVIWLIERKMPTWPSRLVTFVLNAALSLALMAMLVISGNSLLHFIQDNVICRGVLPVEQCYKLLADSDGMATNVRPGGLVIFVALTLVWSGVEGWRGRSWKLFNKRMLTFWCGAAIYETFKLLS